MPISAFGLIVICYLNNPFMKTLARYLIVAFSIFFTLHTLELIECSWLFKLLYGLIFATMCFLLELMKVPDNIMKIIYEIISVFASIGYISIFSGLIIDFISFLAFYFSLDEVILNSILLSIGNNVGDFFGNGALAKSGEGLMGGFATYSG